MTCGKYPITYERMKFTLENVNFLCGNFHFCDMIICSLVYFCLYVCSIEKYNLWCYIILCCIMTNLSWILKILDFHMWKMIFEVSFCRCVNPWREMWGEKSHYPFLSRRDGDDTWGENGRVTFTLSHSASGSLQLFLCSNGQISQNKWSIKDRLHAEGDSFVLSWSMCIG